MKLGRENAKFYGIQSTYVGGWWPRSFNH